MVAPAEYVSSSEYIAISGEEEVNYVYNSYNYLAKIITESTTYIFNYDSFGNASSVKVGDNTLASYEMLKI